MEKKKETEESEVLYRVKVKKSIAWKIRRKIFEGLYEEGEEDGIIYNYIFNHAHLTIGQIRYRLEQMEIYRTAAGIKKIADSCRLPYEVLRKND